MSTKSFTSSILVRSYENGGAAAPIENIYVFTGQHTRTGVPNPRWRQQIRDGSNASTQMTASKTGFVFKEGSASVTYWFPSINDTNRYARTASSRNSDVTAVTSTPFFPIASAFADNQALIRVFKAIRETQFQISGPVFLGELRQTMRMLKSPADALVNYSKKYLNALQIRREQLRRTRLTGGSSGRLRKLPGRFDAVLADTWLEYSFGWSPFLGDVKSAAETLARFYNDRRTSAVSGFGELQVPAVSGAVATGTTAAGIPFMSSSTLINSSRVKYRCGVNATLGKPRDSLGRLIELSGFKLENFIPAAWELLPYSFLIDYFSNIGDVIEAGCTDTTGVTRTTRNQIDEVTLERSVRPNQPAIIALYGANLLSYSSESLGSWKYFNRSVNRTSSGLNFPSLRFELPGKPAQFANLAALLVSGQRMQPYR